MDKLQSEKRKNSALTSKTSLVGLALGGNPNRNIQLKIPWNYFN